jgi:hypothetical protein
VTIIGDGPELPHLKELSAQLRLTERVRFAGARPRLHEGSMAGCHVLVLASSTKVCPTLLEAMSMGIPCIVSGLEVTGGHHPRYRRALGFSPSMWTSFTSHCYRFNRTSHSGSGSRRAPGEGEAFRSKANCGRPST